MTAPRSLSFQFISVLSSECPEACTPRTTGEYSKMFTALTLIITLTLLFADTLCAPCSFAYAFLSTSLRSERDSFCVFFFSTFCTSAPISRPLLIPLAMFYWKTAARIKSTFYAHNNNLCLSAVRRRGVLRDIAI